MFVLLFSIATSSPLAAQPQPDSKLVSDFGRLRFVDSVHQDDLATVTSVQVSDDGKFLYASAWNTATIVVFKRDVGSGMLTPVQELTDRENQQGVTGVRLSPNRRFAVSSAFRSQTISLFRRLHQDGTLERVSLARDGDEYVTLRWPVDVAFSPDSSFLYVADAGGSSSSPGPGSVVTLCITAGGKLIGVDSNDGDGECFGNVRGIAVHPDGKTIVVAAAKSGTVVVLTAIRRRARPVSAKSSRTVKTTCSR